MSYRGRFAPSPTGLLHLGSLVAALGSWLCARHAGGAWLIRMEDIDPPREVHGSAAAILAALRAFGLIADEPPVFQSSRKDRYDHAFDQLREAGLIFPCWCSRHDLAPFDGVHRDGRCVSTPDHARMPAWRMRAPDLVVSHDDALQGPQRQNLRDEVGDFVIRRVEGFYSYQLCCVVDDAAQDITDVVRGSDLLDSTPRQIWLQRCLGLHTPRYLHLPLVLDAEGRKLSKSGASPGIAPMSRLQWLHRAGEFLGVPFDPSIQDVSEALDDALARFDPAQLRRCSAAFAD